MKNLTSNMQKLLVFLYDNDGITKETQNIYNSIAFYLAVDFLKKNNLIRPVCFICRKELDGNKYLCDRNDLYHKQEMRKNENMQHKKLYSLTLKGIAIAVLLKGLHD
jgi:hypothetical protein